MGKIKKKALLITTRTYVCIYVCMYVYTHTHTHTCIHIHVYTYTHTYIHTYICGIYLVQEGSNLAVVAVVSVF
jgi:hypothetical protein